MSRLIITYAEGAHKELLDVALPTFDVFARRHGYDLVVGENMCAAHIPPAWNKIPLLLTALCKYDEVVWFDCDLVVVDPTEDFPPLADGKLHSMVRHFEGNSEVPNSGVWRVTSDAAPLLRDILKLDVFRNHGWWEQAALLTLMGYCVPPEGSKFADTKCRNVQRTQWYDSCQFMRLKFNSHPNYRADNPAVVHCSYPDMPRRLEVMKALVADPTYQYPKFDIQKEVVK